MDECGRRAFAPFSDRETRDTNEGSPTTSRPATPCREEASLSDEETIVRPISEVTGIVTSEEFSVEPR
jgi:hypothetical protein